jgi:3'(2'), 5'-bisphosphate nucleotidase
VSWRLLDGTPLRFNQPGPDLSDLLVCRPELADALLTACAGIARENFIRGTSP